MLWPRMLGIGKAPNLGDTLPESAPMKPLMTESSYPPAGVPLPRIIDCCYCFEV
jgi:hypothetical protein